LATIVKILNNHLGALQEIDARSNSLQSKIAATKNAQNNGGNNGLGGGDINDFFASEQFRGLR